MCLWYLIAWAEYPAALQGLATNKVAKNEQGELAGRNNYLK